jgi:hypothetical protein
MSVGRLVASSAGGCEQVLNITLSIRKRRKSVARSYVATRCNRLKAEEMGYHV